MIRIILVDDHTILRDGIRSILTSQRDLEVVGAVSNGQELLELLPTQPTDVVLMDLNMPVLDGFATLPQLHTHYPTVRPLILSMLDHEKYVSRVLESGALGYVLKNSNSEEIIHAIRTVAAGRTFLCTELGLAMMHKLLHTSSTRNEEQKSGDLSKRELEVLGLIAEGLTNAEIADKLFTSRRTIETHRQNIIEKTQAKNTAALIKFAVNSGLVV